MEYFSNNAFLLGILLSACLYLTNLVFSFLCIIYKIKIVEFSVFFNPWFSLHREVIRGAKFTLGWLPFGCSIKPLGMSVDEEEKLQFTEAELPFVFFTKPKYLQQVFRSVPWVIYIIASFISVLLISKSSFISDLSTVINYIVEALKTMFSDSMQVRQQFIESTKRITNEKNIVIFAFVLLLLVFFLLTPITLIMGWYGNDSIKKNKFQKTIGFILSIAIMWFIIWKIPKFIFSFFSFSQGIIYIWSFLVGMFSVGIACFYITLFGVKNLKKPLQK